MSSSLSEVIGTVMTFSLMLFAIVSAKRYLLTASFATENRDGAFLCLVTGSRLVSLSGHLWRPLSSCRVLSITTFYDGQIMIVSGYRVV